ncbi:MAG: hypothetical protein QOE35_1157 [Actinomycetota bacterium]
MLRVGLHVRALLAAAVVGTLGGNAALLLHPASASAPRPRTDTNGALAATTTVAPPTTVVEATAPAPDLTAVAIAAVQAGGGVAVGGGGRCATDALEVSFDDPGPGWTSGAFVSPLGPAPTAGTTAVNGIVRCAGSHLAYIGFMAALQDNRWDVELVPDVDLRQGEAPAKNTPDKAPLPKPAPSTEPIVGLLDGPDIEGYARYEGQSTCDPTPKPGTLALRNLLLSRYPVTRSLGISRGCDVGGRSEHKEGRAFDWGANVTNPAQRAAVDAFLNALFATDSYGHRHALARRMGVMYVIWNGQIWSAYRADAGWQPYSGASPHTDHVHISLSWAGARAETSYYSGTVVTGLPDAPLGSGAGTKRASAPAATDRAARGPRGPRPPVSTTTAPLRTRRPGSRPTGADASLPSDAPRHWSGATGGDLRVDGDHRGGSNWRPGPTTTTTAPPSPTTTSTSVPSAPG